MEQDPLTAVIGILCIVVGAIGFIATLANWLEATFGPKD